MKTALRILIIEDSEDDALLILHHIKKGGYDIVHERVETAEKTKAMLAEKTWDIILSDYKMPHFNGLQALAFVKETGLDIPFIIISGTIGEDVAVEAMKAGAHDYIMKDNLKRLPPAIERELRELKNRTERKLLEQKQKQAEQDRLEHLHFIESMDRINLAIQKASTLESMMTDVLDAVLEIFNCDRTFLMYPCDPESSSWEVPMECTKPEYPGVLASKKPILKNAEVAKTHRILLNSDGPVKFSPGTVNGIPSELADSFQVKTFMSMAIHPKIGKPWQFGIHQCSCIRNWTTQEEKLFLEIGRRLSDALTSVLVFRDLQESELQYREIFENSSDIFVIAVITEDKRFKLLDFNPAWEKLIGVDPAALIDTYLDDYSPEDPVRKIFNESNTCLEVKSAVSFEQELKIGTRDWIIETTLIPVSDSVGQIYRMMSISHDITERKKNEIEIAQMNRVLRLLSESSQALIHIMDEETLLNEVCRIAVDVGGYRMAWVGFVEPNDQQSIKKVAQVGIENEQNNEKHISLKNLPIGPVGIAITTGKSKVVRNILKDSSLVHWHDAAIKRGYKSFIALPLRREKETMGVMSIYSGEIDRFDPKEVSILEKLADDLAFGLTALRTRVKRDEAEQALSKSEERYRLIADNTADTITVLDLNLNTVYVSPSTLKLRGFTVQEASSQSLEKILTPDSLQKAQKILKDQLELEATGTADPMRSVLLELEEYRKDGSTIWVELSASFIRDKNLKPTGVLTVTRDITERKRAEEQIRKLSLAVEQSPVSIIMTNIAGAIEYVNPKFTAVTGYSMDEVRGRNPRILKSGETSKEEYTKMWETILAGKEWRGEFRNRKKNGEYFWETASISPVRDEKNAISHFIAVKENITDQKQKEKELKQNELRRRELERELIQSQKLESLGTLASGIAHDFNNILGIIIGYADIIKAKPQNQEKTRERLQTIIKAATRGQSFVRQLLTFARKTELKLESIQVETIVNDILKLLVEIFPKTIIVKTTIEKNMPSIVGDATQIHQLLLNLCVNARDAMPTGGTLTLSIKAVPRAEVQRKYSSATAPEYIEVLVEDTGLGMDVETQKRIFEPFFTTKGHGKGTGLGLSIVFGVVESHGGFIGVSSEIGKGSAFDLYFPAEEIDAATPSERQDDIVEQKGGSETILIIEDEEMLVEMVKEVLVEKGYKVITANDGEEGVILFGRYRKEIAVVLTDLGLPILSGEEVVKRIKAIEAKTRFILASGYIEPDSRAELLKLGIHRIIQKPYLPIEVVRSIREVIDAEK